jgi:hypothetical protein
MRFVSDVLSGSRLVPDDKNPTLFSITGMVIVCPFALEAKTARLMAEMSATKALLVAECISSPFYRLNETLLDRERDQIRRTGEQAGIRYSSSDAKFWT